MLKECLSKFEVVHIRVSWAHKLPLTHCQLINFQAVRGQIVFLLLFKKFCPVDVLNND